jgi:hypothetical protein
MDNFCDRDVKVGRLLQHTVVPPNDFVPLLRR